MEEIRGGGTCRDVVVSIAKSSASSEPSTPSTSTELRGTSTSSSDFSPRSLEKHCRPISSVLMEAESKGTLIERLDHIEDRLVKMEEEMEAMRPKEDQRRMIKNDRRSDDNTTMMMKKETKKSWKGIVKKWVK
ncbi:hypothetical protein SAY86_001230 [Trapa natans]|uniref:Uncharacterized protein n=1 Tax=Trapa natans TaxID=22666 RepID=A0AAN7RGA9_TRANT|nr:hypothetical protein SAY86_001230 [Trapa natans]